MLYRRVAVEVPDVREDHGVLGYEDPFVPAVFDGVVRHTRGIDRAPAQGSFNHGLDIG